jgi:hypothetical protein
MSCEAMKMGAIMTGTRLGATLLLLALPGSALAAPAAGERLVAPALPGFVVGYTAGDATRSIKEEVPKGETVERWTRMVTTQRFGGLAAKATPAVYAKNIVAGIPQACPGAAISPVAALTVAGRAAARFQVDCPRNAQGQAETFILLAIAGKADMHVKQVAFRGRKNAADLTWARTFLAGTVLCGAGDKVPACR